MSKAVVHPSGIVHVGFKTTTRVEEPTRNLNGYVTA